MKNWQIAGFLAILIFGVLMTSGCISRESSTAASTATQTAAPTVIYTSQLPSVSPTHFSGSASDTQGFAVTRGGGYMLTGSHSGKYNFIVHIKDNTGEIVDYAVFNAIGSYTGKKVIHLDSGKYFIEVLIADGPWTIDISPT